KFVVRKKLVRVTESCFGPGTPSESRVVNLNPNPPAIHSGITVSIIVCQEPPSLANLMDLANTATRAPGVSHKCLHTRLMTATVFPDFLLPDTRSALFLELKTSHCFPNKSGVHGASGWLMFGWYLRACAS